MVGLAAFRKGVGFGEQRLEVLGDQQIALLDDLIERLADIAIGVENLGGVAVGFKSVFNRRRRGIMAFARRDG